MKTPLVTLSMIGTQRDYSATNVHFDTFSDSMIVLHERWHTWFCLYRCRCLHLVPTSHFYFEYELPNGMPYVYDSSAKFQSDLLAQNGWRFDHLARPFTFSFVHHRASSNLRLPPQSLSAGSRS